MNMFIARAFALLLLAGSALYSQVPQLINYEGRVAVNGVNFDGAGQFKFALIDAAGTTSYWSNDGTGTAGSEPGAAVTLTVMAGKYSVLLGDTTLPNMAAIPAGVFNNADVFVRVWFNDGTNGSQLLTPDQRIAVPDPGNVRGVRDGEPAAAARDCWQQKIGAPIGRSYHAAVWTGSEMIVWGGYNNGSYPYTLKDGGRYDPVTNCWTPLPATGAPTDRRDHTAVWTGTEMIVWGGQSPNSWSIGIDWVNTGGRYNPITNTWRATAGVPLFGVENHTAVWTGSEMIIWGGDWSGNEGGRYDPVADRWTVLPELNSSGGVGQSAVWTGSEMIIWGGGWVGDFGIFEGYRNTGSRYDPAGNRWTRMTTIGAPWARANHTAVWTGSEMLVWGGQGNSPGPGQGGRYDPVLNVWIPIDTTGQPPALPHRSAVWTGSEMIVWGGGSTPGNDGGRYDPAGNRWTPVTITGAPGPRRNHTAVWTGSEMIVWGGWDGASAAKYFHDGARYSPADDRWTAMNNDASIMLIPRSRHTAVWTGSEMIVWGGHRGGGGFGDGARYDPAGNDWTVTKFTGLPSGRYGHTAVWTGSEMIVWGGYNNDAGPFTLNNGGRYNAAANSWTQTSTTGAPGGRADHTAVWTGSEMIVWGGSNEDALNDGGRYDPAANSWTAVNANGAPAARWGHTALWTGSEMIVWGGTPDFSGGLNDGSRYHPADDRWTAVSTKGAPAARRSHTAVWTGTEMIVWGGGVFPNSLYDGGRYHPEKNSWTPVTTTGAPAARFDHTAVWTGSEMIVWGGTPDFFSVVNTGGRYHPGANSWTAVTATGAPAARRDHTAVWTGSEMIVWGGEGADGSKLDDTFSYTPECEAFRITRAVLSNGNLSLSFPAVTGRIYTLWHSDTLTDGSWTNTGLTALAGTGGTLTFTVPATAPARRFFRVHADP